MARFNARTAEQIETAAKQGDQWKPGLAADAINAGNVAKYTELRTKMTAAYNQGRQDAADRIGLYDDITKRKEYRNAITAYEATNTEPAISYIVGYAGEFPVNAFPSSH